MRHVMRNETQPAEFYTVAEVSRADGEATPASVRAWERAGKLPAIRTASGIRLFRRDDVERFLAARRAARTVR
jgi:DNA-binding transcriptional MerR regulator